MLREQEEIIVFPSWSTIIEAQLYTHKQDMQTYPEKTFVIRWNYVNLCLFKRKKSTRIPLSLLAL